MSHHKQLLKTLAVLTDYWVWHQVFLNFTIIFITVCKLIPNAYQNLHIPVVNIRMVSPGGELVMWVQCGKQLCGVSGVYKFRSRWLSQQGRIAQFQTIAGTHHYSGRRAHVTKTNIRRANKNVALAYGFQMYLIN